MRMLLVEDDAAFGVILNAALTSEQFEVDWVRDGLVAAARAREQAFDVILLDMGLPGCDGFEVCERLRAAQVDTPILVVTGCDRLADRVRGLDAGADDYVIKPVEIPELLARVRALSRRGRSKCLTAELAFGPLRMDSRTHVVTLGSERLDLTALEYRLLEFLMLRAGTLVSREELIMHVWGGRLYHRSNSPEVYISYLREKLARGGIHPIRTVRGVGYMFGDTTPAPDPTETVA